MYHICKKNANISDVNMIHVLKSVASGYIAPMMHEKYMIHRVSAQNLNTIIHNVKSSHFVAYLAHLSHYQICQRCSSTEELK